MRPPFIATPPGGEALHRGLALASAEDALPFHGGGASTVTVRAQSIQPPAVQAAAGSAVPPVHAALTAINAAIAKAVELNEPVDIVIVDDGGNLVASVRM